MIFEVRVRGGPYDGLFRRIPCPTFQHIENFLCSAYTEFNGHGYRVVREGQDLFCDYAYEGKYDDFRNRDG